MAAKGLPSLHTHLLRALYRECTYLPDEAARKYWHDHILYRYRKYCPRKSGDWTEQQSPKTTPSRQKSLINQAKNQLGVLRRANAGYEEPLERVLAQTYGRRGKRRHELLAVLQHPDVPEDHQAVARLIASADNPGTSPQLSPAIKALAKAQKAQPASQLSRISLKKMEPEIPKTNSWGRTLPKKREKNIIKKWVGKFNEKLLPPLPVEEWERLRDLCIGNIPWDGLVKRRTCHVGHSPMEKMKIHCVPDRTRFGRMQWQALSSTLKKKDTETSMVKDSQGRRINGNFPHNLTPRYMRRLWMKIFLQCPTMALDPNTNKWRVQWGTNKQIHGAKAPRSPDTEDLFIWQGIDDLGQNVMDTAQSSKIATDL